MAKSSGPKVKGPGPKASAKKATKSVSAPAGPPRRPGVERRQNHPLRAKGGLMTIILTSDVDHVGKAGDLVKVRPGFARNYLLPQGKATFATAHNLRIIERHREHLRQLADAKKAELRGVAAMIAKQSITIYANANPEGHLYGSVNADQIAAALQKENLPVLDEHVMIEGPLKELGLYTIKIHLAPEIETEVKLWVVPTHTEEAPA